MPQEEDFLKKRWRELAQKSASRGLFTFTGFLSEGEQALLVAMQRQLAAPVTLFGGTEQAERRIARFGGEDCFGQEDFPIVCLAILPKNAKFSDAPTHRDFLGALMHLGIERETLGDIVLADGGAYLFCTETAAVTAERELLTVRRTTVTVKRTDVPESIAVPVLTPLTVQVTSERLDALIARAYKLSREDAQQLFPLGRVFKNGAACMGSDTVPREGDIISVRGFGRFRYAGLVGLSKKGKKNVLLECYGAR